MKVDLIFIWSALTTIIITIIGTFLSRYFLIRYNNSQKNFLWVFQMKLENSFLLIDFKEEEIKNNKIIGNEIKLIKNANEYNKFFQNLILEKGYFNKNKAKIIQDKLLNNLLKPFISKWEKYSESDIRRELSDKDKKDFFNDLVLLKKEVKEFYEVSFVNERSIKKYQRYIKKYKEMVDKHRENIANGKSK